MAAKKKPPQLDVTRVWLHQKDDRAVVEYDEVTEKTTLAQKAADKTLAPSPAFHEAMGNLAPFIGAPYGLAAAVQRTVRPREVRLFRKEADEGKVELQVKLYGTREPEGFDANVALRVPKQEVVGGLKKAVDAVIEAAIAYIGGERGESKLDLQEPEENEE